jgi:RNA polymerase sigma-70 factor (ECF subfamily)
MQATYQVTDASLIQAFQDGDQSALEQLINRHKDRVYTTIYMLVKDQYLAEDIFQDTFLKVIRTIKDSRYDEQGKFLPWLLRVAHNLCMDHFRKVRKTIPIITEDGQDLLELMHMTSDSAVGDMERRQTYHSVRQLIDLLDEEQREVVIMRVYGDLSFKEIADITNVSINTALGRMRYALINLRKMIAENKMILR